MTFVIALTGKKSIWLLTDRRLSSARSTDDTGIKTIHFDGTDGQGMMGYAGLGRTAGRRQPSDWMKDQLVGRSGLTTEQCIECVAEAMKAELPSHLRQLPLPVAVQHVWAPVVINGEPRLYFIETTPSGSFYTRFVNDKAKHTPPRIAIAGSGAKHLPPAHAWVRPALRLLAAFERGKIDPRTVADHLARINNEIASLDEYVSKECIVTWRQNGGGQQFYNGVKRIRANGEIPSVANGMDIQAILRATLPSFIEHATAALAGQDLPFDSVETQRALDRECRPPILKLK